MPNNSDLAGYVNSYIDHRKKAVKALGDPSMVQAINGWLSDLKHFAEKIYDECERIVRQGGVVSVQNDPQASLTHNDFNQRLSDRMNDIFRIRAKNDEIAKKHGIKLRPPW
jgi:hypothetical protein